MKTSFCGVISKALDGGDLIASGINISLVMTIFTDLVGGGGIIKWPMVDGQNVRAGT